MSSRTPRWILENWRSLPSYIDCRQAPWIGSVISVVDGLRTPPAGAPCARWTARCEDHQAARCFGTWSEARAAQEAPGAWCEGCAARVSKLRRRMARSE